MKIKWFFILFWIAFPLSLCGQELLETLNKSKELSLSEFLEAAGKNTFFEEILIDTLQLKYAEVLALPAQDFVLGVKGGYEVVVPTGVKAAEHGFNGTLSLSKLFAASGTSLSTAITTSGSGSSQFNLELAQPIAQNAFGKVNRKLQKLTQIENRILQLQVVEAYEDYYAQLITLYFTWHAEYAALQTSQNSYSTSRSLIQEMESKFNYGIANRLDLDKSNIQFYSKWDSLIQQENRFRETLDLIKEAMMIDDESLYYRPILEEFAQEIENQFDKNYELLTTQGRTYEVFDLLEEGAQLNLDLRADELLPSANLYARYNLNANGIFFKEGIDNHNFQVGVNLDYPIASSKARAQYEVQKISTEKTSLSNHNKKIQIKTELKNLIRQLELDQQRLSLGENRIQMAQRIAQSESKDYNLGKSDLNDLISALNQVDSVSQSHINNLVRQNQNRVELLRFTDQLISEKVLNQPSTVQEKTNE